MDARFLTRRRVADGAVTAGNDADAWEDAARAVTLLDDMSNLPSVSRLARALPSHRHCDEHIRGHQACLDEARAILRNLESVEEATRP